MDRERIEVGSLLRHKSSYDDTEYLYSLVIKIENSIYFVKHLNNLGTNGYDFFTLEQWYDIYTDSLT